MFHNLTGLCLYSKFASIQEINDEINACKRLVQCDLLLHQQVSSFSLKHTMRLFIDYQDDVARLLIWMRIRLAVEGILLTVWCSFVYFTNQDLLLFHNPFTIAVLALFSLINYLPCAIAFRTWSSGLGVHTWTKLRHLRPHASSLTPWACDDGAFLTSATIALGTNSVAINGQLRCFPLVYFFQCYL